MICGMEEAREKMADRQIAARAPSKSMRRSLLWQEFMIVLKEVHELRALVSALEERVECQRRAV